MHRPSVLAAASVLALILAAGPSLAQETLRIGASVDGRLESGDAAAPDDEYRYDDYRFQARAGQRLEAIMRSDAFDSYLEVYADGAAEDALASDDDGLGDGVHARLRFTPEADGTYVLRARNLSGLETGAYSLSLRERPPAPRAPRPGSIRKGGEVSGAITDRDPEQDDGGRYDAYAFRAAAGERFVVTLEADDFDPLVRVGRMNGADFEELAQNDDAGGGGLNSRLIFTAPTAGEYIVRATALSNDGTGDYTLGLGEAPPPPPSKPITLDETVRGALEEDTALNDDGARADLYRFTGVAGQRIAVEMKSSDFDTYLTLRDASDMSELASDDDGAGDGTNSRLAHVLEADGDYLIEARAFSDGTGDYSLTIKETPPPPPPSAAVFGETVQGEIGEDDPLDGSGRGYDAYVFTGVEGQRVQAVMRSGDFDAYLEVGAAGDDFEALASDDDGLAEGTDSRLNFTVPEAGDYVVRASPLGSDAKGLYSIEFIDRGPEPKPGSLLVGSTARGTLSEADAMTAEGAYYDAYRFQAKAEEKLRLTLVSNAFDAFIEVGTDETGTDFEILESDDDSLSDTHARLDWTAPEDGWFVVRARSFGPNETGAYALTVERQP